MSESPKAQIVVKALDALAEFNEARDTITAAENQIAKAKSAQERAVRTYAELRVAAKVFGFDLDDAMERFKNPSPETDSAPDIAGETATAAPIREAILKLAEAAYPHPVRASMLQAELEKTRGPLHYKTVGMTLYRLSKEGRMQRRGQKDWFYVPAIAETKNPGGETPGLFNSVDQKE